MRRVVLAMLCTSALATGCLGMIAAGPVLQVTPSRASAAPARPKPAGCDLDFYRTKSPDRAYDEVATVHYLAINGAQPADAQTAIQAKACELGADGVVVTRERYLGYAQGGTEVTATAVVYRPSP